jgi:hypothetical protein
LPANGNGPIRKRLNTSINVTGLAGGGQERRTPDNFIVANPQYAAVVQNSNLAAPLTIR